MADIQKDSYSLYKYYRGETENPFKKLLDKAEIKNTAKIPPLSMRVEYNLSNSEALKLSLAMLFWEREQMFENQFNQNNFSIEYWCPLAGKNRKEWKKALNPPIKTEMFKIWNKQSLTQIADNRELDFEFFRRGTFFTDDSVLTAATMDALMFGLDYTETYREYRYQLF
jgi:hypothetical protein